MRTAPSHTTRWAHAHREPAQGGWLLRQRQWCTSWLVCATLGLGACASTRPIDGEVRSFAPPTHRVPTGAQVQIERLPSQQNEAFAPVAKAVAAELGRQGLSVQDSPLAPWVAQIGWQIDAIEPPTALRHPMDSRMWLGTSGSGMTIAFHLPVQEVKWTLLNLSLVLRERATQAVAFETHARYQGPWDDADALADALVRAAFNDYPHGQPTPTTVRHEIAR